MAIIGILAAAFVPKLGGYIAESKKVSYINKAKNIVTAYESISLRNELDSDLTLKQLLTNQGSKHLISENDIDGFPDNFTVKHCVDLVSTTDNDRFFDSNGNPKIPSDDIPSLDTY